MIHTIMWYYYKPTVVKCYRVGCGVGSIPRFWSSWESHFFVVPSSFRVTTNVLPLNCSGKHWWRAFRALCTCVCMCVCVCVCVCVCIVCVCMCVCMCECTCMAHELTCACEWVVSEPDPHRCKTSEWVVCAGKTLCSLMPRPHTEGLVTIWLIPQASLKICSLLYAYMHMVAN